MSPSSVAVLGSTGSIGTQTLDIVEARPDRYRVVALGAARSVEMLAEQAQRFRPSIVALADASRTHKLADQLPPGVELLAGADAMAAAASEADTVINGCGRLRGAAGDAGRP